MNHPPAVVTTHVLGTRLPSASLPSINLQGVPFTLQPDGTYVCPLPIPGTETIGGQQYTAKTIVVLTPVNPKPPPVPVPVPPVVTAHVSGYMNAFGALVTQAKPGDTLVIEGVGFGGLGSSRIGRVMVGPGIAGIQAWTDAAITVTVPNVTGVAVVKIYTQQNFSGWQLLAGDGPALVIAP